MVVFGRTRADCLPSRSGAYHPTLMGAPAGPGKAGCRGSTAGRSPRWWLRRRRCPHAVIRGNDGGGGDPGCDGEHGAREGSSFVRRGRVVLEGDGPGSPAPLKRERCRRARIGVVELPDASSRGRRGRRGGGRERRHRRVRRGRGRLGGKRATASLPPQPTGACCTVLRRRRCGSSSAP